MGGICTVVELIISAGMLAQEISEMVLKNKIDKILKEHDEQFRVMDELYKFVDQLLGQLNLIPQLNLNVQFILNQWANINEDLEERNTILQKILEKFSNVNTSGFQFTASNGSMFSVSQLTASYESMNFVTGNPHVEIPQDIGAVKDFLETLASVIRSNGAQINLSAVNEDGSISKNKYGKHSDKIPGEFKQPRVQKVKAEQRKGSKHKAAAGLRVIFIAVALYGFVQGAFGLAKLKDQLDQLEKYFKEQGEFDKAQLGVAELMNDVASDIFNLANFGRAAIYESKNVLLVKSITLSRFYEESLDYARQLDPDKVGIGQTFIAKSSQLIDNCNSVQNSGKSPKDKLKDLLGYFTTFYNTQKPSEAFQELARLLSVVSKYGLVSDSLHFSQLNSNKLLKKVGGYFEDQRGGDFNTQSADVKKQRDMEVISRTLDRYLYDFEKDGITLQNMDEGVKDIIFHAIISYTDQFYYDDPNGKTIFKKEIHKFKQNVTYGTLLKQPLTKATIIPVRKELDSDEKNRVDTWLGLAKQQNEKEGFKYWQKDDQVNCVYRYLRLTSEEYTGVEGEKLKTLVCFEGIHLEAKKILFNLEKNITKEALTLTQV